MQFQTLRFTADGDLGLLTLARPEVLNAMDIPMARELETLSENLRHRPSVRALIVTGEGRAFCAGGDLSSFRQPRETMEAHSLQITQHLHRAILNLSLMDLPVIAAVNGAAAGAGFALACACDAIVAARSATFMAAYTLAGLSPDLGLTHFLPRQIGLAAAKALILTNRRLSAEEAAQLGLVAQVVEGDALIPAAKELCRLALKGSAAAIGATKRLLSDSFATALESQLAAESISLASLSASEDAYARCRRFIK
jgi:2-(1,2-epoxy-1,2-dihydrophenyl)acetyl-CoA isomerase